MADEPQTETRRMKPWLKVVFALSLALNLLVAGAVVASLVKGGGWHEGRHARFEHMGGPLSRALSKEDRREIGAQMRKALGDDGAGRAEHRRLLGQLKEDLRAEPFDRQAVAAHMARQRGVVTERMEMGHGLLLDRLERMSPQDRVAFADRFEAGLTTREKKD